jgi:hypothetical protein
MPPAGSGKTPTGRNRSARHRIVERIETQLPDAEQQFQRLRRWLARFVAQQYA